jgi:hypothetical protein
VNVHPYFPPVSFRGEVILRLSEPCSRSIRPDEENIPAIVEKLTPVARAVNSHHPNPAVPLLIS